MKHLILQISDLHFKAHPDDNHHLHRSETVARAIRTLPDQYDSMYVVVSGDIAHSGQAEEYSIAHNFFESVKNNLAQLPTVPNPSFVFVPGNHDCNFDYDNHARKLILENLGKLTSSEIDKSVIDQCTTIQNAYFDFVSKFNNVPSPLDDQRLYFSHSYGEDANTVKFLLFNTAWVSQLHEAQGKLYFPTPLLTDDLNDSGLVISVFHHPYNWLSADNARAFRKQIEQISDIVFTGHEHDFATYTKSMPSGEVNQYIEGAVFQEPSGPDQSGFNVVSVDTDCQQMVVYQFQLKGGNYALLDEQPPRQRFTRNFYRLKTQFELSSETFEYLDDPGANFTHAYKINLRLRDIYVFPDFEEVNLEGKTKSGIEFIVRGEKYQPLLYEHRRLVVSAPDQSGKTAFARTIFRELREAGLVPVLLNGRDITSFNSRAAEKWVRDGFRRHYDAELYQRFTSMDPDSKVLIVDDFHQSPLNAKGRRHFLRSVENRYGYTVLLGSEAIRYQELFSPDANDNPLLTYKHLRMLEFGHVLREELIERWFSLGREFTIDPDALAHRVMTAAKVVETLVGKDLLPACPIYILVAIQQIEANIPIATASGAYGYFYELLITRALSIDTHYIDLDTKHSFLSHLAYWLFKHNIATVSESELRDIHTAYCAEYQIRFSFVSMLDDLIGGRVFRSKDDRYTFKYRYMLYYFIARYVRDNINEEAIRDDIDDLMSHLYRESYANIVIFLTYLSRDPYIMGLPEVVWVFLGIL